MNQTKLNTKVEIGPNKEADPDLSKLTSEDCKRLLENVVMDSTLDYPKTKEQAQNWDFKYWKNQPVQPITEKCSLVNIIDPDIKSKYSCQAKMFNPYNWTTFDLANDKTMDDICTFLNKHYLTDNKDHFRLYYTKEYIRWSLGSNSKIIGITTKDNIIGGLIASSTGKYQIFDKELKVNKINYLCIHPKLRKKKLAEMFIDEITRLSCNENIIVGSFTTQRYVPTPICRVGFYHRPLNYEKLYQTNFIRLENNEPLEQARQRFDIKYQHKHKVVKMDERHFSDVYSLLCTYQDKYNYYQKYSFEEFKHCFANNNIVSSYVILDDQNDILDFYSYYKLPYYVTAHDTNKNIPKFINAVYMNMYTSINVTQLTIFKSAVKSAYEEKNDVFNCTDIMENMDILFDNFSKFTKGTGYLYYNFYNLSCPELSPQQTI